MTVSVSAQHGRTDIKGGIGLANISLGQSTTPVIYGEFTKVFIEPMIIGVYVDFGMKNNAIVDSLQRDFAHATFDLGFYYSIINNKTSKFEFGLSFSGHYFNFTDDNVLADPLEPNGALEPGFGCSMNYNRIFDNRWFGGFKISYHFYNNEDKVYMLGLHGGMKF